MKNYFKVLMLALVAFSLTTMTSCSERIDVGFVGMVQTPSGLSGEVLQPGNHTCWGRDKMALIENAETNYKSHMDVLCADELNFKFDVNVLVRLENRPGAQFDKQISNVLERQGGKITWDGDKGTLNFAVLYQIYLAPQVDAIARSVIGKYQTTQIRANRDKIEAEITAQVIKAAEHTPLEIITVVTSNFDYPDIITQAQEKAKKREIQLKEEDNIQALNLKKLNNRSILAEKEIVVRAKEAKAEAVYVQILGHALNKNYLQLKAIENQKTLYSKSTNTLIVPEGSTPFIGTK